jgi:hypothetical protein
MNSGINGIVLYVNVGALARGCFAMVILLGVLWFGFY